LTLPQGVHVPGFFRIAWSGDGPDDPKRRPLFFLSDRFATKHALRFRRPLETPSGKVEDINFVKIALKFSNSLTKDTVFTALRRIIIALGEKVAAGAEVEIDLAVGTLVAKEKAVVFAFESQYYVPPPPPCGCDGAAERRRAVVAPPPDALGAAACGDVARRVDASAVHLNRCDADVSKRRQERQEGGGGGGGGGCQGGRGQRQGGIFYLILI
jgi:hypothetical protein